MSRRRSRETRQRGSMSEFRWINTSLFLILVLQFTAAATGQRYPSVAVRDGDDVTLPCDSVIDDHENCDSTTWLFTDSISSTAIVELVKDGQMGEEAEAKSDRLSVSENCSLVVQNVTHEDGGVYICRQFRSGRQQGPDAVVLLSVVTMTEHEDDDEVTLRCSVTIYEGFDHTVKWLLQGPDVEEDNTDFKTSQAECSASLTFPTSHFIYTSRFSSLKCEVTRGDNVQQFSFRNSPSGEKTGDDTITATTESTATEDDTKAANTTTPPAVSDSSPKPQTAATGQRYPSVAVRDGDDVTLPCDSVIDDHENCDSTTWLFTDSISSTAIVELVKDGQMGEEAEAKSDRLSVSENCSLVVQNVTHEDGGVYICRQFRSGRQQGPDAVVLLSVVTMTEHEDDDEVTLRCSVTIYEGFDHTVKWLLQGPDVEEDNTDFKTSQAECSASLTFPTSHFIYTSRFSSLKCEVTRGDNVQQFSFRNSPSGEKTGDDTITATTESTPTEDDTKAANTTTPPAVSDSSPKPQSWWRFISVSAGLVAPIIIVVDKN